MVLKRNAYLAKPALGTALAIGLALAAAPVFADTKAGVDAWQAGDFATAIKEWRSAADAGDPDAAFNLGQAYKTGRGVTQDLNIALDWYARAMNAGHVQAADLYGLTLYQIGRKGEAMPYIQASSARGEPRAQYVYGAELFNGKLVEKDWPRAYAMMNRASAQGLAPAGRVLAEMDQHIPLDQRQQGLALSAQLEQNEARERTRQMAGYDTGSAPAPTRPVASGSSIETFQLPPSASAPVAASGPAPAAGTSYGYQPEYAALPEVKRVPADAIVQGESTESSDDELDELPPAPAYASARPEAAPSYAPTPQPSYTPAPVQQPVYTAPPVQQPVAQPAPKPAATGVAKGPDGLPIGYVPSVGARPNQPASSAPAPAPARVTTAPAKAPAAATGTGLWRVQLGAYDNLKQAENSWYKLEAKFPVLAGNQPYLVKYNNIVRLQYGPFATKAEADKSCAKVKSGGQDCFVLKSQP